MSTKSVRTKETLINDLKTYVDFLKKQPLGYAYQEDAAFKEIAQTNAHQLDVLKKQYAGCMACPLAQLGRSQVVFGAGNPEAALMFVGEGPGRDEDAQGVPFVGRAGQLLTSIIAAMGLTREEVYISNVVKCRPPENRAPLPNESETCKNALLYKEIAIIKPKIICTLGSSATQALLGPEIKITKARGLMHEFKGTQVLPTFHPAYLLRNPADKRLVWEDMKKIMSFLGIAPKE